MVYCEQSIACNLLWTYVCMDSFAWKCVSDPFLFPLTIWVQPWYILVTWCMWLAYVMHQWAGVIEKQVYLTNFLQGQVQISHRSAWTFLINTLLSKIAISHHTLLQKSFKGLVIHDEISWSKASQVGYCNKRKKINQFPDMNQSDPYKPRSSEVKWPHTSIRNRFQPRKLKQSSHIALVS